MPKVSRINKSRKDHKCSNCTRVIPKGASYRRWSINFGSDYLLCDNCPTPPRSRFTTSEIRATCWDIVDDDIESFETQEEFEEVVRGLAERIDEEVLQMVQEKLDNIESGIGHTDVPVYEELQDRLYELESWKDEVEAIRPEDFIVEGEACSECGFTEDDPNHDPDEGSSWHEFQPEDEFIVEDALEALQEAVDSCPE